MYQALLVPVDGSETSMRAMRAAADFAHTLGARLDVVYVTDPFPYTGVGETSTEAFQMYMAAAQAAAEKAFDQARGIARDAGLGEPRTHLREDARVARAIVEAAAELGSDLIVIGSHGRSGVEKLVLGSVTAKLLPLSHLPVLVIR